MNAVHPLFQTAVSIASGDLVRKAHAEPTGLTSMTLCESIWDKGYDEALLAAVDAGDECEAGRIAVKAAREYAASLREIGKLPCKPCNGSGKQHKASCPECHGSGNAPREDLS